VRLALCRRLLLVANLAASLPSVDQALLEPAEPRCCPACGGSRLIYRELDPLEPNSVPAPKDSS
jgi:hypothetical protein